MLFPLKKYFLDRDHYPVKTHTVFCSDCQGPERAWFCQQKSTTEQGRHDKVQICSVTLMYIWKISFHFSGVQIYPSTPEASLYEHSGPAHWGITAFFFFVSPVELPVIGEILTHLKSLAKLPFHPVTDFWSLSLRKKAAFYMGKACGFVKAVDWTTGGLEEIHMSVKNCVTVIRNILHCYKVSDKRLMHSWTLYPLKSTGILPQRTQYDQSLHNIIWRLLDKHSWTDTVFLYHLLHQESNWAQCD